MATEHEYTQLPAGASIGSPARSSPQWLLRPLLRIPLALICGAVADMVDADLPDHDWPANTLTLLSSEVVGLRRQPLSARADGAGGLWIAARGELVRWTSSGISERHLAARTAWMVDGRVTHLAASEGVVWIGTPAGIGRLGAGAPAWFGPASGLPDPRITALVARSEGPVGVFAGTWRGLSRLGPSGFVPMSPTAPVTSIAVGGAQVVAAAAGRALTCGSGTSTAGGPRSVTALRFSAEGVLWAGGDSLWSCDDSHWRRIATIPDGVVALAEDANRRMWVGSGEGLFLVADDGLRTVVGPTSAALALQPQGSGVVVGTWGDGLWDCTGQTCKRRSGISEKARVASIAIGTAGSLWVTADGALHHCEAVCRPFDHPELAAAGSLGPVVYDDGVVWVGAPGGGGIVRIANLVDVDLFTPDRSLPDADIHALLPLQDALWLATDAGLVRYARSQFVPSIASSALALAVDSRSRLWVGTDEGLRQISDQGQESPIRLPTAGAVRAIVIDRADHIWAGGPNGLVEIGAGDTVDHTPQLPDASVRDLAVDAVGSIWVATSGGLARWSEGSWRRYSRREGLPSNVVWAVHADSRGGIWVGTYGAGAARLEGERFRPLNSSHGLPSNVVRQILDDGAGKLWFVTDLGLASLSLDLLPDVRPRSMPGWLLPGTGALLLLLILLLLLARRGP